MNQAQIIKELRNAWTAFKATNDERMKRVEKQLGTGEVDSRLDKLNKRIANLSDKLDQGRLDAEGRIEQLELQLALNTGTRQGDPAGDDEIVSKGRQIVALNQNRPLDTVDAPTAEQTRSYLRDLTTYFRRGVITNEMTIGGDPQGGYWVSPDMSGRIVKFIYETSPMRSICAVQEITTDRLTGPNDFYEASFGWVGETEERPETDTPDLGEWQIPVDEAYAEPRASQNLLDDSGVDIEAWLSMKIAERLARGENKAFIDGNGIKKPRGLLSYPTAATETTVASWGTFQHRTTEDTDGPLTSADTLILLTGDLKSAYMDNARWGMNRRTLAQVRTIKDADNNYVFVPDFSQSPYGMILGHPVSPLEDMPNMGAAADENNLPIAFGDFMKTYQIVQRQGIRVLRDNLTKKPYVKFYTTCRVGGDVLNFESMKFIKQAA